MIGKKVKEPTYWIQDPNKEEKIKRVRNLKITICYRHF